MTQLETVLVLLCLLLFALYIERREKCQCLKRTHTITYKQLKKLHSDLLHRQARGRGQRS